MPSPGERTGEWERLARRLRGGDLRTLARGLTWVESGDARAECLLEALGALEAPREGFRLGITGAPGVGKSSLVARLVGRIREGGERVAVLAVDPTSPVSGGALLGDRLRMGGHEEDPGVFIRSLASRGGRGGLAACTDLAATLVERAGFALVLIETVGAGQLDMEIAEEADHVWLLLSPESGDTVQFLKGGVMEVVDRVVVNKCDRPGADDVLRLAAELAAEKGGLPPLAASSRTAEGIDELAAAVAEEAAAARAEPDEERRRRRIARRLRRGAEERWIERHWREVGGRQILERLALDVDEGALGFHAALDELVEGNERREETGD